MNDFTTPTDLGLPQGRRAELRLQAISLLIFLAAAGATLYFLRSMAGGMEMPGNWTMSMMWMLMPGQSWVGAAAMFVAMWLAMMVAMMLPSALPMLLLYRRAVSFRGEPKPSLLTWIMGAGYFGVWTLFGVVAYGLGMAINQGAMIWPTLSRSLPAASGGALILAGVFQLTPWKSACLKHCRDPLLLVAQHLRGGWKGALGLGLHHGLFCSGCCWSIMLIQLVLGVMNLPLMIALAVLIALEKLLPKGDLIARVAGVAAILGGIWILARALWVTG